MNETNHDAANSHDGRKLVWVPELDGKAMLVILLMLAMVAGFVGAILAGPVMTALNGGSNAAALREFYITENAAEVSPYMLQTAMDANSSQYVVVDLRATSDYLKGHVKGAISIPGTLPPGQIVAQFRQLEGLLSANQTIVTLCYSPDCMLSRQIGLLLSQNGIYVQDLNTGWAGWATMNGSYIQTGNSTLTISSGTGCGLHGTNSTFGC